jgi:hypothetical protein
MSSKPGRTRKVPNKEPTSLASPAPFPFIAPVIDPQLLALDNSLLAVADKLQDEPQDEPQDEAQDEAQDELQDELQDEPQDELQDELQDESKPESKPILAGVKSALQWTLEMERVLFNELLEQANTGKRVDNGFK